MSVTSKLYFDARADRAGFGCFITDDKLQEEMKRLVDDSEVILQVYHYENPLTSWQITKFMLYHSFLVFETKGWYWSLEKNEEGVTIQRSKDISSVVDYCRKIKRTTSFFHGVKLTKTVKGSCGITKTVKGSYGIIRTMKDLINYIWRKNSLLDTNGIIDSSGQEFATRIMNHFERRPKNKSFF